MAWYLYIAQAGKTGNYYVGISTDVAARIEAHNMGKGATMARTQGRFTLRYTSPALRGQSEARKLEMRIKKWDRARKEELITGERKLENK